MIVDAQPLDVIGSRAALQDTPLKAVFILLFACVGTFGLWLETDGNAVPTAMVLDFLNASGNDSRLMAIPILSITVLVFATLAMGFAAKSRWLQRLRCAHGFVAVLSLVCCGLWIFFGSGILRFTTYGFYFQLIGGVFALIVVLMSEEPSEEDDNGIGNATANAENAQEVNETEGDASGLEVATVVTTRQAYNDADPV